MLPSPAATAQSSASQPSRPNCAGKAVQYVLNLRGRERSFSECEQQNPKRIQFSLVTGSPTSRSSLCGHQVGDGHWSRLDKTQGEQAWATKTLEKKPTQQSWEQQSSQAKNRNGKKGPAAAGSTGGEELRGKAARTRSREAALVPGTTRGPLAHVHARPP